MFKRLIKKDLIFFTEEEDESGFDWTPTAYLTKKGEMALAMLRAEETEARQKNLNQRKTEKP